MSVSAYNPTQIEKDVADWLNGLPATSNLTLHMAGQNANAPAQDKFVTWQFLDETEQSLLNWTQTDNPDGSEYEVDILTYHEGLFSVVFHAPDSLKRARELKRAKYQLVKQNPSDFDYQVLSTSKPSEEVINQTEQAHHDRTTLTLDVRWEESHTFTGKTLKEVRAQGQNELSDIDLTDTF